MDLMNKVDPRVFRALQSIQIKELLEFTPTEIRPILPCLVRMSLISPFDNTLECSEGRKGILTILSDIEIVNTIVALLSIDFHALESDVKKEQQLRQKVGSSQNDSILIQSLQDGPALEFERTDCTRRLRIVLSEMLFMASQIHQQRGSEFYTKSSDLFDNIVYVEEICDVISIALAELPAVLNIHEVIEILLHVKYGPDMICWVVSNSPDCFREVCIGLMGGNGLGIDRQDEEGPGGRIRMQALIQLCQMNPTDSLAIRAKCVELCRMPALAIILSLPETGAGDPEGMDVVAFISGLLLGNDQAVRSWFVLFVRNVQKRKWDALSALQLLRDELLRRLQVIVQQAALASCIPASCVVQASALLRLYCALRGIAGIKFQDDEIALIVQLVTSRPPPTPAGVRFVSVGLCMLIACPSLIGQPEHEKKSVDWVQWLVREEAYFESASAVAASFGEMLLLMAIHFHSNQLSAICELVCTTVGMKVPIRTNNMARMKQIFTHDIFTEQVVTAHAVKVPVTPGLNANIPGFLPIHCIHQLLKSRAFTKHKVPIKSWIYRQICCSEAPLHPLLPALVEVYVSSILVPSAKTQHEHTNQPIAEDEVRRVFQNSVFGMQFDVKRLTRFGRPTPKTETDMETDDAGTQPTLTSQLLLLYYLLLYEDMRLTQAQAHRQSGRKVKSYSTEFLSELPIKYLLLQAQKDQQAFASLFPPLLRLLATHFPHLSLVDDWLCDDLAVNVFRYDHHKEPITRESITLALGRIHECPSEASRLLRRLLATPPTDVWPFADTFVRAFKSMLDDSVPRFVQELYKKVWLRLNTVLPRCLWVMSINALLPSSAVALTQENLVLDPLQAFRCDPRVFRCASALAIFLRIVQALLAASRNQLERHQRDRPLSERSDRMSASEHNEIRNALVATQDSLAVQILLEACLETSEDKLLPRRKWALREVRSVVCSYLHQIFIAEPSLAKLVHFQCYSRELIPVMVRGIPSMHICLDFLPELLSQPYTEKQVFAVDLVSHLSLQYDLPKSLSVARLAVNALSTLLAVHSFSSRAELFLPTLPSLVRICNAFPPLLDDVTSLLLQIGHVSQSQESLDKESSSLTNQLCTDVQDTFMAIQRQAAFDTNIYS